MSTSLSTQTLRSRVFISLVLVIGVLLAGIASAMFLAGLKEATPLRDPVPRHYNVEVFRVQSVDLQELVSAFGTVEADKRVVLAAQVAGEVLDVHPRLKVGGVVHAADVVTSGSGESLRSPGDVLVVIDPRTYQERVIQVESRIAEARAELARLEQEFRNLERLNEQLAKDLDDLQQEYAKIADLAARKIATDSDLRRAQIELRTVETRLVQNRNDRDLAPTTREQVIRRIATLQNDLELVRHDLERATVRPPFDGELTAVSVQKGQYVRPGDPLVTLVDPFIVVVPLAVSLEDFAKLAPVVRAGRFPVAALAENETAPARWHGRLVRVAPQADERTRTVMIYVQVDNNEQETPLLPGMFVQARIDGPMRSDVLVVPRDAVLNGRGFLLQDETARKCEVEIQRTLQGFAIINSGFSPGDRVILSNLDVLYDGAPVHALFERTLADELERQTSPLVRLLE